MDREDTLKLYQYCNGLCYGLKCDDCPYKSLNVCNIMNIQNELRPNADKDFRQEAVDKYFDLSREVSAREVDIVLGDFQNEHCRGGECDNCKCYRKIDGKCSVFAVRMELIKQWKKSED